MTTQTQNETGMANQNAENPKWIVRSLKRPTSDGMDYYHDRWTVGVRNDENIPRKYDTKYDGDYDKEMAKEKARKVAEEGERIRIKDLEGDTLRTEVVRDE